MGLKLEGLEQAIHRLANIGKRSSKGARRALEDGARDIAQLAALQAPRESGALERAIDYGADKSSGINRRDRFVVFIRQDLINPKSGKPVGDYADLVHEGLHDSVNGPGPGTILKQESLPGIEVGPFFMERAAEELEPRIRKEVERQVKKAIR